MKNMVWIKRMLHPWNKSAFYKNLLIIMMVTVLGIVMAPAVSKAWFFVSKTSSVSEPSGVPLNSKGIYTATADDGGKIYLYRYAPYTTGTPQFRTSGTPIVLFTGIGTNMNQYLACTPSDMTTAYRGVYVPPVSSAPAWALNSTKTDYETYIKADNMRYYSFAHYLWLQGYDVWLVNYRGTGRSPIHSKGANPDSMINLDIWATLDVPAAIAKVKSVTGKRMFIGGHSTGGLVSYAYLQGAYLDYGIYSWAKTTYYKTCFALGYMPHVKASATLAKKRNADIKGFIGIDPAGVPALPNLLDSVIFWTLLGSKLYIPVDTLIEVLVQQFPSQLIVGLEETIFGLINTAASGDSLLSDFFDYLNFWVVEDMDPCMEDWIVRYAATGIPVRGFGQYMDMGLHNTIREHYLNGSENYLTKLIIGASTPSPGRDGYYYYDQNMSRMTVPMIVFSSATGALVSPEATYDFIISKKSPTAYDLWYVVGDTGHLDVAMGRRVPTAVFPQLGAWLKTVNTLSSNPANTTTPAVQIDE
ncbi:MAG: alpha/beta hydrolase [Syntrophaceae bacterium]|nr:alpha/beta hydrolase [Syntrophaceae bacterium]